MSCNGCRVLRKGCSETCVLRSSLRWIESAESQGNATLFLAKFFGRSDLLSLISSVPEPQRPVLFQSLLFEACGRTVNPVNGAVGLLSSGNWHICQAAVETVLQGGTLRPVSVSSWTPSYDESSDRLLVNSCNYESDLSLSLTARLGGERRQEKETKRAKRVSFYSEESEITTFESNGKEETQDTKILKLFV